MAPHLAVADRPQGRQIAAVAGRPQARDLVQQTGREHGLKARIDGRVKRVAGRRRQDQPQRGRACDCRGLRLPVTERPAGAAVYLQAATDALAIGRRDARRRCGIDTGQLGVQRRPAARGGLVFDRQSELRIGGRQRRQAPFQCAKVQEGAADQQRHVAAGLDLRDQALRVVAKFARRVGLVRIANVDQVVRHGGARGGVGLGGADVHAPVHLAGVHADDLARQATGDGQRQRRLAGGGRTEQENGGHGMAAGGGARSLRRAKAHGILPGVVRPFTRERPA